MLPVGSRKTGRTITLTYSGTLSMFDYCNIQPSIFGINAVQNLYAGACQGGALGIALYANVGSGGSIAEHGSGSHNIGVTVQATMPAFSLDSGRQGGTVTTFTYPGSYSNTFTGSWSITGTFDEWESYQLLPADPVLGVARVDSNGFPLQPDLDVTQTYITGYGSSQFDGLPAYQYHRYLVSQIGTTISGTITVDGQTASVSLAITGANQQTMVESFGTSIPNTLDYGCRWTAACTSLYASGTTAVTCNYNSASLGQAFTQTSPDGYFVASASSGATIAAANSSCPDLIGQCNSVLFPSQLYTLNARARCFNNDYPGSGLQLNVAIGNNNTTGNQQINQVALMPAATASITQPRWDAEGLEGGTIQDGTTPWITGGSAWAAGVFTDQWTPVRAWLNDNSLASTGDDRNDWAAQFAGFAWNPLAIGRSGNVVVDPCTAVTNWSAGSNTTIAITGGYLVATVSGAGTGAITLNIPSGVQIWEAFRYLQFAVLASGMANVTITIGGETWTLPVTTSLANTLLDLTSATGDSSAVGSQQTRYPVASTPNSWPTTQYSLGWGTDYATSLTISNIPASSTLTLEGVTLVTSTATGKWQRVSLFEPFSNFFTLSGGTLCQSFGFVETDGRSTDISPGLLNSGGTASWPKINDLATYFSYLPGITVTTYGDPNTLHTAAGTPALHLGGSTWDWGSSKWKDWLEVDVSAGAITVQAQDRISEILVWPGAGDFWNTGTLAVATPLNLTKHLRGDSWGICYDPTTRLPIAGALVTTVNNAMPTTSYGSGTTNPLGAYETGTPWALEEIDVKTQLQAGTHPSGHRVGYNRWRSRWSFAASLAAGKAVAYDVSRHYRHGRALIDQTNGHLKIGMSPNGNPYSWVDVDAGFAVSNVRIRWQEGQNEPLGILYSASISSHILSYVQSLNEGQSFTAPTTIASTMTPGAYFDFEETSDLYKWFFWQEGTTSPFTIWYCVLDPNLNVIIPRASTVINDSILAPVIVRECLGAQGQRVIGIEYNDGTNIKFLKARDGQHFS